MRLHLFQVRLKMMKVGYRGRQAWEVQAFNFLILRPVQRLLRAFIRLRGVNHQSLSLPSLAEQISERNSWLSMRAKVTLACKVGSLRFALPYSSKAHQHSQCFSLSLQLPCLRDST